MELPQANLVLFFLSAFVGLWGVTVVVRGRRARRDPGSRRCRECGRDMRGVEGQRCPGCGFEVASEEELQRWVSDRRMLALGAAAVASGVVCLALGAWVRSWEHDMYDHGPGLGPLHAVFWGVSVFGAFLAAWAWRGDRSRGRRRCPRCGYDMSAAGKDGAGLVCPECGCDAREERRLYLPRRRRRLALNGLLLVAVGVCGQTVPRALRTGPVGLVPTTVLIAGSGWLPESWYLETGRVGATLGDRLAWDLVWEWQRGWAGRRARAAIRRGLRVDRVAPVAVMLSGGRLEDRETAIVGMARLLGDESVRLTASEADELWAAYGGRGLLSWWDHEGTMPETARVREAVRAAEAGLAARLAVGSDGEAALCAATLACGERFTDDAITSAATALRSGSNARVETLAWFLAEATSSNALAVEKMVELSADPDAAVRWRASRALGLAAERKESEAAYARLAEMVERETDPVAARGAAEALVRARRHSGAMDRLLANPALSLAARAGFADAFWRGTEACTPPELLALLPVLAGESASDAEQVLLVLEYSSDVPDFPVGEVLAGAQPLLGHPVAAVSEGARKLLGAIAAEHPERAAEIEAVLRAQGEGVVGDGDE